MDKYNEDASCPKCGNRHVGTKFEDSSGCHSMRRECKRCLYTWLQIPLDKVAPGETA